MIQGTTDQGWRAVARPVAPAVAGAALLSGIGGYTLAGDAAQAGGK